MRLDLRRLQRHRATENMHGWILGLRLIEFVENQSERVNWK